MKFFTLIILAILGASSLASPLLAQEPLAEATKPVLPASHPEEKWGIGFGVRVASNPYVAGDSVLEDVFPLLYYDSRYLYLDGLEAGFKLRTAKDWRLNLLARWRFIDVPEAYNSQIDSDVLDWGFRFHYQPDQTPIYIEVDLLADESQRLSSTLKSGLEMVSGRLEWDPYVALRLKDSRFNDYYYGLATDSVGSGTDISLGIEGRYYLGNDLYLQGSLALTWLDEAARISVFVDDGIQQNIIFGLVYRNDRRQRLKSSIDAKPYLRLVHGWATPSDTKDIITFNNRDDDKDNKLLSLFYGHPLSDELFGLALKTYLTPGFVWHWQSDVQDSGQEFVLAIKNYYTFDWPSEWRVGLGTGFSYAAKVSYIEEVEMAQKGYENIKWLLYLDFSLEMNLGKLFHLGAMDDIWLGYSLHHRSGIFGASSMFGRIKGGSNYNTISLQYHF
ncbi:MAG: MipA/OmpV family protein [Thermodesulfobacteriota bacterium]